jgi:putative transcriptional regulator
MSGMEDFDNILGLLSGILSGEEMPASASGGLRLPETIDVAAIRKKTGMTQAEFARSIAVPVATLRNWEQRHREPKGPARVLLAMVERKPGIVKETLAA